MNDRLPPTAGLGSFEELVSAASERLSAVSEVAGQLRETYGVGEAAEGKIRAEVLPGGALRNLHIDPRAMKLGSQRISEAILEAIQSASEDATQQLGEVLDQAVPGAGAGIAETVAQADETAPEEMESRVEANVADIIDSLQQSIRR